MFELVMQNLSEKKKIPFGYNELKKFQQRAALLLQGCIVILGWYSFV